MKLFNITIAAFVFLASCSGGGSTSGSMGIEVNAFVTKGPVSGAECQLYQINSDGEVGGRLARGLTLSDAGLVEFGDLDYTGAVLVECSGGTYTDEASGLEKSGHALRTVTTLKSSEDSPQTIIISIATEIAVRLAEMTGDLSTAITSYNAHVAAQLGLGDIDITAVIPTDINNTAAGDNDAGEYAVLNGMFSQVLADGSEGDTVEAVLSALTTDLSEGSLDDETITNLRTAITNFIGGDSDAGNNVDDEVANQVADNLGSSSVDAPSITASVERITAVVGTAITGITMVSDGGAVDSYSISPALPAGLAINSSTGIISGTPTTASVETDYTVTATNAAGSDTATITITVTADLVAPGDGGMTASVDGESITFSTDDDIVGTLDASDFTIDLNGGSPAVSVSTATVSGGTTVTLTLSRALQSNNSGGPGTVGGENADVSYVDADNSANLAKISAQAIDLTEATAGDCSDCVLDANSCPF